VKYLLDTDHLSIVQRQSAPEYARLMARIAQHPLEDLALSIISFHEQVLGCHTYINRARTPEHIVHAYAELETMQRSFCKMNILSFTEEAQRRWKLWWQHVHFDQYAVWVLGCFAGMMLPVAMSLQFVKPGEVNQIAIASMQAQGISDAFAVHGAGLKMVFWYLTMFTGFLILWFTQVQVLDHVTRRWTDILWTGSETARTASGGAVQRIYYTIASVYALMNCGMTAAYFDSGSCRGPKTLK